MEEAPENSKESSHSARAKGMNETYCHQLQQMLLAHQYMLNVLVITDCPHPLNT
jgi:hypothetical protein